MGWTYKLHGGVAAGLGAALMAMAALSWVPGTLQLFEPQWPMVAGVALALLAMVSALVGLALAGAADKHVLWQAFRCLTGRAQAGLAALAVAGVAILVFDGPGGVRDTEVRDGRYLAYDSQVHRVVEVSKSEYQALLPGSRRKFLAIPGVLLVGASCMVLAAGEVRRADRGQTGAGNRHR
ncbi:hypothetical protein J7F02_02865 [Streptomyces sp. ISL-112]|uniref:hypothetical protein n=1 Tax=unclassified Streptomyces TaxID=2593676 RepID=UPI001BEA55C3|nr:MULTISPECIES: hypothetical protein [unclassified Streptomyces]MBT2424673.1 hypothetical protein [Streptomyces sp. ISL-112]MBT2462243.1 hypothetical protein [Streptomyces sp. ISL-63]